MSTSPVKGQVDGRDRVDLTDEIAADVTAQDGEREPGRPGGVAVGHPGVAVLLELERGRPAVLDRVAEPMEAAHAGVPTPGEDEPRGRSPSRSSGRR